MYRKLSLYIGGEFLGPEGRTGQDVINPATEQVIGHLPHASDADLQAALNAADHAFASWRRSSPIERSKILRRVASLMRERAEEIARCMTLDQGKPLSQALSELAGCAEHAEWHAEECRRIYGRIVPARRPDVRNMVIREPVGVCVAFTPWNFPMNQAIRKVSAAIGAGCTMILKGPEDTPSAVVALAELFHDAGLPPGVLNVVWGIPEHVSTTLINSPVVRKISFTGSVPVGKKLAAMAGANMQRATMELGGHSPVIVFDDAPDIDKAAEMLVQAKLRNAGQVCVSPTRFYVQRNIHDRFVARFAEVMSGMRLGSGLDAETDMGPLVHERRISAMQSFVDDVEARGGEILLGGSRLDRKGYFYAPTIAINLPDDARLMHEEPFGPIAPVTSFDDVDEVIQRANSLPFGLAAYVFTGSIARAHKVSSEIEAGMVNINYFGMGLSELPFGGIKDSGIGSEGGTETFDGYLTTKLITQI